MFYFDRYFRPKVAEFIYTISDSYTILLLTCERVYPFSDPHFLCRVLRKLPQILQSLRSAFPRLRGFGRAVDIEGQINVVVLERVA